MKGHQIILDIHSPKYSVFIFFFKFDNVLHDMAFQSFVHLLVHVSLLLIFRGGGGGVVWDCLISLNILLSFKRFIWRLKRKHLAKIDAIFARCFRFNRHGKILKMILYLLIEGEFCHVQRTRSFQDQALEPCYLASGQQDGQIRVGRDRVYLGQLVDYPEAWTPQRLDSQVEDAGENNGNRNGNVHNRANWRQTKLWFLRRMLSS